MKEKLEKIGTIGTISCLNKLKVRVRIIDYKYAYGHDRWLIEPVEGSGQVYVENVVFE